MKEDIGKEKMEYPKTCGDCYEIYKKFEFQYQVGGPGGDMLFPNARNLVDLNNIIWRNRNG